MRLVVGLGNPGREYEATRHNVGFMVVEELARRWGVDQWRIKDQARQALCTREDALLVEPQSFMNLSGAPVRVIASWYRTEPPNVLVISDDMDLAFGRMRMRPSGGHGGHNGLRSIIGTMTDAFPRLRIGVGRPERDSIDHVLSPFSSEERISLPVVVQIAADGVERWLNEGVEDAMQSVNSWVLP
ncbi:MAG: aminoacyl-tRNA hydrolase [Candidatus Eremiobacteraeota bacterium]|nr:aminoacyl-tRNA hydrolase [Candidatus Eremiobacteraeota bacterium]